MLYKKKNESKKFSNHFLQLDFDNTGKVLAGKLSN